MKQGMIKFVFERAERAVVDIVADDVESIQQHPQWLQIKTWWLFGANEMCQVTWDDGSEMLLNRDKIVSITMTLADRLEID